MKAKMNKQALIYIATVVFSVIFIIIGSLICRPVILTEGVEDYYRAEVVDIGGIEEDNFSLDDGVTMVSNKRISFSAKMKNGPYKGDVVEAVQDVDDMYAYQPRDVEIGDEILLSRPGYDMENGAMGDEVDWVFIEHNRISTIIWLVAIFLLLIALIGRKKGISTILSLLFTVLAIFLIYIPSILKGYNIYLMTTIISLFAIFMSLIIINGWNLKTICAIFGNITGIAISGILAVFMHKLLGLTGMIDEDYVMLTLMDTPVDLRAVLWGGLVIGALGAIMDVAMSIASAMKELNDTMSDKTFFRMLHSGMNIGRDAIGTMTNTLILAYIGGALATVLLLVAYNKNMYYLFNMEMITAEIVCAIVGSIGILAAVPATALISAYMFNRYEDNE
ncbi:MAG: YibE/F family protein [Oscillospiraceae bacterium]|nr:YibE/F family protein [Oscillospiraceae bacterium]